MSITEKAATPERLAENSETLLHAEGLRTAGQSASAIAHDIDVAMAPISLYTNALLEHEPLSDRARHYLSTIRRAVDDVLLNVGRLRELDRPRDDAPDSVPRTQRPANPARSLRVLLIDDDPSLVDALRTSLTDEGHKVSAANGGQSGIDTFRAARSSGLPFDIVITDLSMPDVDGRQVVENLRAISPGTLATLRSCQLTADVECSMRIHGLPPASERV